MTTTFSPFSEPVDRPRRFYAAVDTRPAEGGFAVRLDGRTARTPGGAPLVLPTDALAAVLAGEWDGQVEKIVFSDMPATRLAFTVIDRLAVHHAAVAREMAQFAASDLLCYFAEAPQALVDRQHAQWGPVLDWAERELKLGFHRAAGIVHRDQPPDTLARVEALATALDDFTLGGLAHAAPLFGSAVLALALQRGRLTGEGAFALARLDEAFQEEQWGVDAEAAERTSRMHREAQMLEAWFRALQ